MIERNIEQKEKTRERYTTTVRDPPLKLYEQERVTVLNEFETVQSLNLTSDQLLLEKILVKVMYVNGEMVNYIVDPSLTIGELIETNNLTPLYLNEIE